MIKETHFKDELTLEILKIAYTNTWANIYTTWLAKDAAKSSGGISLASEMENATVNPYQTDFTRPVSERKPVLPWRHPTPLAPLRPLPRTLVLTDSIPLLKSLQVILASSGVHQKLLRPENETDSTMDTFPLWCTWERGGRQAVQRGQITRFKMLLCLEGKIKSGIWHQRPAPRKSEHVCHHLQTTNWSLPNGTRSKKLVP